MNDIELTEKLERVRATFPDLVGRYERGIEIYRQNRIILLGDWNAAVPGQSGSDSGYLVEFIQGTFFCNCADFANGAPVFDGQKYCKHLIAERLYRKNGPYSGSAEASS